MEAELGGPCQHRICFCIMLAKLLKEQHDERVKLEHEYAQYQQKQTQNEELTKPAVATIIKHKANGASTNTSLQVQQRTNYARALSTAKTLPDLTDLTLVLHTFTTFIMCTECQAVLFADLINLVWEYFPIPCACSWSKFRDKGKWGHTSQPGDICKQCGKLIQGKWQQVAHHEKFTNTHWKTGPSVGPYIIEGACNAPWKQGF
eukprot:TRINITY_DN62835_c0_g2_i1.p2 TRINITY_DN62835_c0_g2~~TRINITY_DN62835_c0_g2_i1.p2  ORF type:complete len:215 (-),score=19.15 TRINITY_DN62835_c0_g2_i1:1582-2193(-)